MNDTCGGHSLFSSASMCKSGAPQPPSLCNGFAPANSFRYLTYLCTSLLRKLDDLRPAVHKAWPLSRGGDPSICIYWRWSGHRINLNSWLGYQATGPIKTIGKATSFMIHITILIWGDAYGALIFLIQPSSTRSCYSVLACVSLWHMDKCLMRDLGNTRASLSR